MKIVDQITFVEESIQNQRDALKNHRLYELLSDVEDIKTFMELHVYAVWDFMSLLKSLQRELTCIDVPWKPVKNAKIARFINEIVWGEESDVNELGEAESHFSMYLAAMQEVGADTKPILNFLDQVQGIDDIDQKIVACVKDADAVDFLRFTFSTIATGSTHKIAAAFTFGREDLIPDMFLAIIKQASEGKVNLYPKLSYYLERHIEVDGDDHGPLSLEMVKELCGEDTLKWEEVRIVASEALQSRILLWDAIANSIEARK